MPVSWEERIREIRNRYSETDVAVRMLSEAEPYLTQIVARVQQALSEHVTKARRDPSHG